MSVHDAVPGDVYADEQGKLWRIVAVCHEPTVTAEEVEGTLHDPAVPMQLFVGAGVAQGGQHGMPRAQIVKARRTGATGGLIWSGWKRIWRNDWRSKQPPMPDQMAGAGPD